MKKKKKQALSEGQQLRQKISRLKQLPHDFRDAYDNGMLWTAFLELMDKPFVQKMEAWSAGPILVLEPLDEAERAVLDNPIVELTEKVQTADPFLLVSTNQSPRGSASFMFEQFFLILSLAELEGYSFVYLPKFTSGEITAINLLLSRFGCNVRVRGQLHGSDGRPVGVTI